MSRILVLLAFAFTFSAAALECGEEALQPRVMSPEAQQLLAAANPTRACHYSSDCLPSENCINGMCVFGSCHSDLDCPIGEHCVAGNCKW